MTMFLAAVVWLVVWVAPLAALLYVAFAFIRLPLRRQERTRAFLMLIDSGLKEGRRVEDTIVSLSGTRDPGLGMRFHSLATLLRGGVRLSEALEKVPGILPPQIVAMIKAGEKLGDLRKVMPACRHLLKDNLSQVRGSVTYMLIAAILTAPAGILMFGLLEIVVLPKMRDVVQNMEVATPAGLALLMDHRITMLVFGTLVLATVWLTAFVYIGGPRIHLCSNNVFSKALQRLFYSLPWHRKRMQRDFSTLLAILLDEGVPESEAVLLAADCTANMVFTGRARQVADALKRGMKLPEAVQIMDDTGEFRWRITQAVQGHGGFLKAVAGWNEALDAKAFQQEQSAAQVVTTSLVLMNGLFIGTIVVGVFGVIISLINAAVLW